MVLESGTEDVLEGEEVFVSLRAESKGPQDHPYSRPEMEHQLAHWGGRQLSGLVPIGPLVDTDGSLYNSVDLGCQLQHEEALPAELDCGCHPRMPKELMRGLDDKVVERLWHKWASLGVFFVSWSLEDPHAGREVQVDRGEKGQEACSGQVIAVPFFLSVEHCLPVANIPDEGILALMDFKLFNGHAQWSPQCRHHSSFISDEYLLFARCWQGS